MIRDSVRKLSSWAPLPPESGWDQAKLDAFVADVAAVEEPITPGELPLILDLLDRPQEEDIYGVLHTVMKLAESCTPGGWQLTLDTTNRMWFETLQTWWLNFIGQPPRIPEPPC